MSTRSHLRLATVAGERVSAIDAAANRIERELVRAGHDPDKARALVATLTIACGREAARREHVKVFAEERPPAVTGRFALDDEECIRADTRLLRRRERAWQGAVSGRAVAEYHHSVDDEDRGGVVLRLRIDDAGGAWLPWAQNIPGGVDIHVAGDEEARAICAVLRGLLERRSGA